ncbi:MAG: phosphoribosylformylglycinamidine cyclo-ligase, partial [Alicyclobacillus sp.]|nr:phosphoribosylformylglycinamidine cyclo-ligase [Alicyclobacillus sp.]
DLYQPGEFDLAGTAVGVVNRDKMVDGSRVRAGDVLLGLASDGVHSNGYTLVRKLLAERQLDWQAQLPGWRGTVAEELLRPTRIYVRPVLSLLAAGLPVTGMAHITGGGLVDNVPRFLPDGLAAHIQPQAWPEPPVFQWLRNAAGMSFTAAARVWNLGIGYVLAVRPAAADAAAAQLTAAGEQVYRLGEVVPGARQVVWGNVG